MQAITFHQLGFAAHQVNSVELEKMFQAAFCIDALLRCEVSLSGCYICFSCHGAVCLPESLCCREQLAEQMKGQGEKRGLPSALLHQPQPVSLICSLCGLITGLYRVFSHSKTSFFFFPYFFLYFRIKILVKSMC